MGWFTESLTEGREVIEVFTVCMYVGTVSNRHQMERENEDEEDKKKTMGSFAFG